MAGSPFVALFSGFSMVAAIIATAYPHVVVSAPLSTRPLALSTNALVRASIWVHLVRETKEEIATDGGKNGK